MVMAMTRMLKYIEDMISHLLTCLLFFTNIPLAHPAGQFMVMAVHNVYFVQYDVPVSFLAQVLDTGTYFFSLYILRILAFYAPNLVYDTGE